jgi:hypothetical protein
MAYQKPLVMVFQEYAAQSVATQDATLTPCIIGPCYHIIDVDDDATLAYYGEYTVSGISDATIPNNEAGAEIVESSVEVTLKDVIVNVIDSAIAIDDVTNNVLTLTEGTYPSDIAVGDYIYITDITGGGSDTIDATYRVISLDADTYTITLNNIVAVGEGTDFEFLSTREYSEYSVPSTDIGTEVTDMIELDLDNDNFSVNTPTITVDETEYDVVSAGVYFTYKALRTDLLEINTVYNSTDAAALLGKLDTHDNPLGLGVATTLANTSVGIKVVGITSDDSTGYTAAKDLIATIEDVYAIVPLTQDSAIINIFKSHAVSMSLPEIGKWRVVIGNTSLQTETEIESLSIREAAADEDETVYCRGQIMSNGVSNVLFTDSEANFISNGAQAGHILRIVDGDSTAHEYTIDTVNSEDLLTVTEAFDSEAFSVETNYNYTLIKELNKTQQAEAIAAVSEGFGSSRCVHTWPDSCTIDGNILPGYYLSCTVAGATGGLPSHHGFTKLSVAGIGRMYHTNDYFNQDQLDIIAGGGTFIFTQANPSAPPVVRHQLTTDQSTIEFGEFSFVKNFDYVSIMCKDVLEEFLGEYNITPSTLALIGTAIRSVLESLKLYNLPKIGSPVLNYEIVSIEQMDDIRDRVEATVNIWFPYALNVIGLHLVSQ